MEYVAGFVWFIGAAICGAGGLAIAMLIVAGVLDYAARYMWQKLIDVHGLTRLKRAAEIIRRYKGEA